MAPLMLQVSRYTLSPFAAATSKWAQETGAGGSAFLPQCRLPKPWPLHLLLPSRCHPARSRHRRLSPPHPRTSLHTEWLGSAVPSVVKHGLFIHRAKLLRCPLGAGQEGCSRCCRSFFRPVVWLQHRQQGLHEAGKPDPAPLILKMQPLKLCGGKGFAPGGQSADSLESRRAC